MKLDNKRLADFLAEIAEAIGRIDYGKITIDINSEKDNLWYRVEESFRIPLVPYKRDFFEKKPDISYKKDFFQKNTEKVLKK